MKGNQMQQGRRGRSRVGVGIRRRTVQRCQVKRVGWWGDRGAGSHQTSWTGSLPL